MSLSLKALSLLLSVAISGVQTGRSWPIREAPDELRPLIVDADLAIVSMQDALLRQLHDKLAQGGPELALGACHIDRAPRKWKQPSDHAPVTIELG